MNGGLSTFLAFVLLGFSNSYVFSTFFKVSTYNYIGLNLSVFQTKIRHPKFSTYITYSSSTDVFYGGLFWLIS